MAGITLKASVLIRPKRGARFPAGSYAAALSPARASLVRDTERAFETQADPVSGKAWPPRKHHYAHKPLQKSGAMRREAVAAAAVAVLTGNSLTVKVKRPKYSKFQHGGTRTIAARRFVGASIGTVRIVHAGLVREGQEFAVRVLRGK